MKTILRFILLILVSILALAGALGTVVFSVLGYVLCWFMDGLASFTRWVMRP